MRSNSGKDEARDNLHDPTLGGRVRGLSNERTATKKPTAPADHRGSRQD